MEKRRDLLPIINNAIISLTNMVPDACNLEYHNNDKLSRKLKDKVVKFKAKELVDLENAVKAIRAEINKVKTTKKQQKNESETVH